MTTPNRQKLQVRGIKNAVPAGFVVGGAKDGRAQLIPTGGAGGGAGAGGGGGGGHVRVQGPPPVLPSPGDPIGPQGVTLYALGNTTAASSSAADNLSSIAVSGAGIVSVGFDTLGDIVVSATTAASAVSMNMTAIGNTTGSSSATTRVITAETISGAGGVSVGYSGNTVIISGATGAASGTGQSRFALGNTTAATSSFAGALTALSVSGTAGVSVGYDTNGVLIISGATGGAGTSVNMTAIGNTTGSSSATTRAVTELTISGAGGVSVGYSGNTVIISGVTASGTTQASATSMNLTALGNTTGSSSATTRVITAESISGAGIVSVGYSGNTVLISATSGTSIASAGSGGGMVLSYFEATPPSNNLNYNAISLGTMRLASFQLLAGTVTFDRANFFALRSTAVGTLSVGTTTATVVRTATASAGWNSTVSLVLYSQANATSFNSLASATMSYGYTESWSVSDNIGANSVTASHTFSWAIGTSTAGGLSTTSASSSAVASSAYTIAAPAAVVNVSGSVRNDVPWASSFPAGVYLVGYIGSTVSATATGATWLTVSAGNWSQNIACAPYSSGRYKTAPDDAGFVYNMPRIGTVSTAGSTAPATINWLSLNAASAENVLSAPFINFALFGTN